MKKKICVCVIISTKQSNDIDNKYTTPWADSGRKALYLHPSIHPNPDFACPGEVAQACFGFQEQGVTRRSGSATFCLISKSLPPEEKNPKKRHPLAEQQFCVSHAETLDIR